MLQFLGDQVVDFVGVGDGVAKLIEDEVGGVLGDEVGEFVGDEVVDFVGDEVGDFVGVGDGVAEFVGDKVGGVLGDEVPTTTRNEYEIGDMYLKSVIYFLIRILFALMPCHAMPCHQF